MITVLLSNSEQTVTGPVAMVARLIPEAETVIGEVSDADRMRAQGVDADGAPSWKGHPWTIRAASFRNAA